MFLLIQNSTGNYLSFVLNSYLSHFTSFVRVLKFFEKYFHFVILERMPVEVLHAGKAKP